MNYPWTRHRQRYEYIYNMGYTKGKRVADVGCGQMAGSFLFSSNAKKVYAIDPILNEMGKQMMYIPQTARPDRVYSYPKDFFTFDPKVDLCVGVEVFEHIIKPEMFVEKLAEVGEYVFLTTPLAGRTRKTRNKAHVREYSSADFKAIVGKRFKCIKYNFQTADLKVLSRVGANGDSMNSAHVVQMYYGRRK